MLRGLEGIILFMDRNIEFKRENNSIIHQFLLFS